MEREIVEIRKVTIKRAVTVFGIKKTFEKVKTELSLVAINELIQEDREVKREMRMLTDFEKDHIISHVESMMASA